jgi:hypothetical protein
MHIDQIITIDNREYCVAVLNNKYAGLELVKNPNLKRTIRLSDYPHLQ